MRRQDIYSLLKPGQWLLASVLFFALNSPLYGQCCKLFVAVGDRSATLYPFEKVFDNNFYPLVQAGIEYLYNTDTSHLFYQTAEATFYSHENLGYGFGLRSQFGYRYEALGAFYPEVLAGVGYIGTLPSHEQFVMQDGHYVSTRPWLSRVEVLLSVSFGYRFWKGKSLFIRYQYSVMAPYNQSIIAVPTDNLMLGFKMNLFKLKRK